MKLRHFVSGSSVLLAGWLAVTFVYHVPAQRYQKPEKYPVTSLSRKPAVAAPATAVQESQDFPVSASR